MFKNSTEHGKIAFRPATTVTFRAGTIKLGSLGFSPAMNKKKKRKYFKEETHH